MAGMGGNDASSILRGHFSEAAVLAAMNVVNRFLKKEVTTHGRGIILAPPLPRHKDTRFVRNKPVTRNIQIPFDRVTKQIFEAAKLRDNTNNTYLDKNIFNEAFLSPDAYVNDGSYPGVHLKEEHCRALAAEPLAAALQPLLEKK